MRDGTEAFELSDASAALDHDGYVEEQIVLSPSSPSASGGCLNEDFEQTNRLDRLDHDGYVADPNVAAMSVPQLDHDGYVADPNVTSVSVPQLDHVGYAADLLAGDEESAAPPSDSGMDAWEQTTVPRAIARHAHEEAGSTRI
jgi:hypothetical protein